MKKARRIEGQVTDARVDPAYYVAPLSWWRRAALWLLTTQAGLSVIAVLVIGGTAVAHYYWGWTPVALMGGILIGFFAGYWVAYRWFVDEGHVPKL